MKTGIPRTLPPNTWTMSWNLSETPMSLDMDRCQGYVREVVKQMDDEMQEWGTIASALNSSD